MPAIPRRTTCSWRFARSAESSVLYSPWSGYKIQNFARVTIGLNKGEAHHTLKRAIRFYPRGSVNDRTSWIKISMGWALNLVVAALILWNTGYLDRAIQVLNEEGISVPEEYLAHIAPLDWEHITITGTYIGKAWTALGTFQPLRHDAVEFLRAEIA